MRSHVTRSAIAPVQGYICFSCRHQIARGSSAAKRRHQHNDSSPQADQTATTTTSRAGLANLQGASASFSKTTQFDHTSSREISNGEGPGEPLKETSFQESTNNHDAQKEPEEVSKVERRSQPQLPSSGPTDTANWNVNGTPLNDILGGIGKKIGDSMEADFDKVKKVVLDFQKTYRFDNLPAKPNQVSKKSMATKNTGVKEDAKPKQKKEANSKASQNYPKKPKKELVKVKPKKASTKPRKIQVQPIRKITSVPKVNGKPLLKDQKSIIKPPRTTGISKHSPTKIKTVCAADLDLKPLDVEQPPVPKLAYGLERVLFNPGVYQLQDPRSRVYNFDPYLQKIMPVAEFDFDALREYVTSSKDQSLQTLGKSQGKRYVGSTSSMTSILSHFHFLLSQWRPLNISMLSKAFPEDRSQANYTEIQRIPQAIVLREKDGCYAIDADKEFDTSNILQMLGKSMEKLLTLKTDEFERYRRSNADPVSEEDTNSPESYHYSTLGDFLLRSQLDAHDPRLPGTGMFDLKTRAVVSIRMDVQNYQHGSGYEIKTPQGEFESYEREYFDLIRAAFLKYSMQVRMGRMDGIFVAFHNVERIFGFQYVSLAEMDNTIHGQWDLSIGDQEFNLSLDLLNKILDKATKKYPNTSLRIHFETRDAATPFMYVFAEPVTEEQITELQNTNLAKAQEFERNVLGRGLSEDQGPKWEDIHANVEKTMDEDELGLDDGETSGQAKDELSDPPTIADAELSTNMSETEGDGVDGAAAADEDSDNDAGEEVELDEDEDENENNAEENVIDEEEVDDEEEEAEAEENEEDDQDDENLEEGEGNKEDAEENSEIEVVEEGEKIGQLAHQEHASHGESGTLSEQVTAPLEGSDEADASDELGNEILGDQIHSPDSSKDPQFSEDRSENESSSSTSPVPEEPFSDPLPPETAQGDETFLDSLASAKRSSGNVLAMTLSLRNKVNGLQVLRPSNMTATDKWEVEYLLEEVPDQSRALALYEACKTRRQKKAESMRPAEREEGVEESLTGYVRRLRMLSQEGRAWRKEVDQKDEMTGKPVSVMGKSEDDSQ